MLDVTPANALVYTTLCGFMLVGLYAGWHVKSKSDFISGIRTQTSEPSSAFVQWLLPERGCR
ncbi:hypothetical protein K437DRAFT_108740 [Tilletiaria anomala UBC 951]|uniref:Uncharacterized protein n=1 Tax=Tilletiaria anomala (strain ATCC 24038 / CBS 436.72 / UBC 951) TaxID=1037660 RepID=A0A066VXS2_TILAU|nr:uncharacterized protein K437DRAFT_108740 [Tilletiaria anomala UBC 951]KDN46276.1 hypothetical protein K437DRAFT_108740 [Tilletiaria anomala UBC 951]